MAELSGATMKLALILPLVLAAFIGVARAEEADDIREANKAETETFNARIYAGTPGKTAYACFVRRYDAEHLAQANPDVSKRIGDFSKDGVELAACGNTMKAQSITLTDLLPGFVSAEKGGVVRLAELQSQGYLYLRP